LKGRISIFKGGNMQRIEIRWNNMLPSLWLLQFHVPEAQSHILAWDFNLMREYGMRPLQDYDKKHYLRIAN
jgi:hypothetical protein